MEGFISLAQQPNAGHDRLILEVCRSHAMTHFYLTTKNTHKRKTFMPSSGLFFLFSLCAVSVLLRPDSWLLPFAHTVQHKTNIHVPAEIVFVSSCTLFVLHPYLFLCLDCPVFCLFVFYSQHKH